MHQKHLRFVLVAQEKLGGLRRQESSADEERHQLRHSLEQQEARAAQLEAARRGQEGDLMRARQLVHERDAELEASRGARGGLGRAQRGVCGRSWENVMCRSQRINRVKEE